MSVTRRVAALVWWTKAIASGHCCPANLRPSDVEVDTTRFCILNENAGYLLFVLATTAILNTPRLDSSDLVAITVPNVSETPVHFASTLAYNRISGGNAAPSSQCEVVRSRRGANISAVGSRLAPKCLIRDAATAIRRFISDISAHSHFGARNALNSGGGLIDES